MKKTFCQRTDTQVLAALRMIILLAAFTISLTMSTVAFAGSTGTRPQGMVKLQIGLASPESGMAGLWMAKEAQFFAKEGLDVEFLSFSSGTVAVQALVARDVPVMSVGGPPVIRAVMAGADLVWIAELVGTMPYTLFASPKISTPGGLKGKRLGISRFGSSSEFATKYILLTLGLDPAKDATILQLGDHAMRFAALRAGSIDATVIQPPETVIARRLGLIELADTSRLGLKYPYDEIAVSRSFLRKEPDILQRMLKALIRGTHYFKTHGEEGIRCLGKYLRTEDKEALTESYKVFSKLISAKPFVSLEGIQMVLDNIDDPRLRRMKPEHFVDGRLVRELDESGFIDRLYKQ